jgi:hypothetical protein
MDYIALRRPWRLGMTQQMPLAPSTKMQQSAPAPFRHFSLATTKDKDNDQNEQQKANAAWPNEESSAARNTGDKAP